MMVAYPKGLSSRHTGDHNVVPIDIGAGDELKPEFLKISSNNKMPAMRQAMC
jgi:hypothetical protein